MLIEESGLAISMKDGTTQEALKTYVSSVRFMAQWLTAQDGAEDKSTTELLDEYGNNVCTIMRGEYKGTA